jgi:hypothetical protein
MTERNLSDDDVIAIVDALEARLTDKIYRDLGKGVWGLFWKAILGTVVFIAAYGAVHYSNKP